jgi:serine/threonine-protein kinase RsbT
MTPANSPPNNKPVLQDSKDEAALSMTDERFEPARLPIHNIMDVVYARRRGLEMALALGFPQPEATKIAVVISELGRNIILYTKGGIITLIAYMTGRKGVKIIAQDQGPGIKDLDLVMEGGHSTSKGLGLGVSGSKRLMDEFEVNTIIGGGTKITAAKWLELGSPREK